MLINGVVSLNRPTFDKIVTIAFLEHALRQVIPVFRFWKTNTQPPEEMLRSWASEGIVPIDIGDQKYHKVGARSALERIASTYELPLDREMRELVRLVNTNNRTGYLKGFPFSVVWILREAYKLGWDPLEVIERVKHVVHLWCQCLMQSRSGVGIEEGILDPDVFNRILEGRFFSFTLSEYLVNLVHVETPSDEIRERIGFFVSIHDEAKRRIREADVMWCERLVPFFESFELRSIRARGAWIETDDEYLPREGIKRFPLLIIRSGEGNVNILSRGLDLFNFARALVEREPGDAWFYDRRIQALLNGTPSLGDIPPTELHKGEIIRLAAQHARQARRK